MKIEKIKLKGVLDRPNALHLNLTLFERILKIGFQCVINHLFCSKDTFSCVLAQYATYEEDSPEICNSELRLSEKVGYEQESKVQFVVDAVYAFAYALNNLHKDLCRPKDKVCPAMASYDGGDFYRNYLLNVAFTGERERP